MSDTLDRAAEYQPHIHPADWSIGITSRTMERVVAMRRLGDSWATICIGTLNLPQARVERAYNRLPAHLR